MQYKAHTPVKVCFDQYHQLYYVGINVLACTGTYVPCSPLFPTWDEAHDYLDYTVSLHDHYVAMN